MQQNTQEWLDLRKKHIGASDAPIIMGVSPYKTVFQLWEEKVGINQKTEETASMRYGRNNEEAARQSYEQFTGNIVVPEVVFHPTNSFMMASLDGLSVDQKIILEVKNANAQDHQLAVEGKVPEKYWPQVQHQLDCIPGAIVHYWSFHKGNGVLVEVERDEDYIEGLIEKERSFYQGVLDFEPPDLSADDYIELKASEWEYLAKERKEILDLERELAARKNSIEARKKQNTEKLIEISNGRNVILNDLKFTKIVSQGKISYKKAAEESGLDLEKYRGEPIESWRVKFLNEKKRT